jgi:TolB-like protein
VPRLELLGGFRLIGADEREIPVSGKKNRALLAILALAPGSSMTRQGIAGLLWSDRAEHQARNSLRQALVTLKADLAPLDPSPLVLQDDLVKLDPARVSIDVLDFFSWRASGDLTAAASLFKGPLFAGLSLQDNAFEEWLREQRDAINGKAISVLEQLAGPDGGEARIEHAKRLLALNPLREASHRVLMAAYLAAGEKALALKQYETCRSILKEELGIAPARQTEEQYKAILIGRDREEPVASAPVLRRGAASKPAVAVLPFANLSNDPNQQYLSDGIGADITSALSRFRSLMVVAGNSALRFHDAGLAPSEIGAKLGVDYLLNGSVRTAAGRIRITVQLIAAETGAVLWAQNYDNEWADVFSVQDEVVSVIASTLTGQVELNAAARVGSGHPENIAAYDLALRGFQHLQLGSRNDTTIAIDYLKKAIAIDPNYTEAYPWLAAAYHTNWQFDYVPETLDNAVAIATRGLDLDPHSARCHATLGCCLLYKKQFERAEQLHRRAFDLNPNDPQVLILLSLYEAYMGRLDRSAQYSEGAVRLNPYPPDWFTEFRSLGAFAAGRYEAARAGFEPSADRYWDAMYLVASHGHLGSAGRAAVLIERYRKSHPQLSFMAIAASEPFVRSEDSGRLLEGLRKAGAV